MSPQLDPSAILHPGFSFWNSKVLLTAVEFGRFPKLANRWSSDHETQVLQIIV